MRTIAELTRLPAAMAPHGNTSLGSVTTFAPKLRGTSGAQHRPLRKRGAFVLLFALASTVCAAGCRVDAAPHRKGSLLADSVRDFSGSQGKRSWYYGYWDRSADKDDTYNPSTDFEELKHFGDDPKNGLSSRTEFTTGKLWNLQDGAYYTSLWAKGGHPNAKLDLGTHVSVEHWVIRRWVSTTKGRVRINGNIGKVMPFGNQWAGGCEAKIVIDGKTVFSGAMGNRTDSYSIESELHVGSTVDFLIGPAPSIGVTEFTAAIRRNL